MAQTKLLKTTVVDGLADHPRVKVRFYQDGSIRFEVAHTPMSLDEAYLSGHAGQHAILKIRPR